MLYFWLKLIHIISSTLLFGTGIGTACTLIFAHRTGDVRIIASNARYVVLADWVFTASSGFVQPVTGLLMVYLAGFPLNGFWLWGAIVGYLIAAFCWFPVVYLQIKIRDFAVYAQATNTELPPIYFRYFKYWFYLGFPAFSSLVGVFYLMTFKPMSLF